MLSAVTRITPGVGHRLESNVVLTDATACRAHQRVLLAGVIRHRRLGALVFPSLQPRPLESAGKLVWCFTLHTSGQLPTL